MCAAARDSLYLNARVHLPGATSRATTVTHNVEYIATRLGANREATPDDLRRAELAERMGLAGYYAKRPGSTALFDADGAVPLAEARRRLEGADGALVTLVISVRREEAEGLGLDTKQGWERYLRANLAPALSVAMGVPESSIRWLAAEHENAEHSKHAHAIAWSSDGSFDGLMKRPRLERARKMLTDAALAPAVERTLVERDLARAAAVDAVWGIEPSEIADLGLPADGRISYAHLRRWHPECARRVEAELERLESRPDMADAVAAHRATVERCADLKGLEGAERERYVQEAMDDLRGRMANALLRVVAPDRTEAPAREPRRTPAPTEGPATERRRMAALEGEVSSCVRGRDLDGIKAAIEEKRPIPRKSLSKCPAFRRLERVAPALAVRALADASRAVSRATDPTPSRSDDVGEKVVRDMGREARAAVLGVAGALRLASLLLPRRRRKAKVEPKPAARAARGVSL